MIQAIFKISKSEADQTSSKMGSSFSNSFEHEVSKTVGGEVEPLFTIPYLEILKISGSWTDKENTTLSQVYSQEKSFMTGITNITEKQINLRPETRKEKYKHIDLEPVLSVKMIKKVSLYEDIDLQGMAKKRVVIDNNPPEPVYYIKGWYLNQNVFSDDPV